jgi:hypothetical protein
MRRIEAQFDLELLEEAERRVRRRIAQHLGSLPIDHCRAAARDGDRGTSQDEGCQRLRRQV